MSAYPVLLVEDSPEDAFLINRALSIAPSIQLYSVEDGLDAVAYLEGEGRFRNRLKYPVPELVVTDLKMLMMPGLALIEWIRSNPRFKDLPVIVLSGSDFGEDIAQSLTLGAGEYLIKGKVMHNRELFVAKVLSHICRRNLSLSEKLPSEPAFA